MVTPRVGWVVYGRSVFPAALPGKLLIINGRLAGYVTDRREWSDISVKLGQFVLRGSHPGRDMGTDTQVASHSRNTASQTVLYLSP